MMVAGGHKEGKGKGRGREGKITVSKRERGQREVDNLTKMMKMMLLCLSWGGSFWHKKMDGEQ